MMYDLSVNMSRAMIVGREIAYVKRANWRFLKDFTKRGMGYCLNSSIVVILICHSIAIPSLKHNLSNLKVLIKKALDVEIKQVDNRERGIVYM